MGQAILDLPDPSQLSGLNAGPLSPEALASAEDLLSQLAGDDIDRLLAEAEADRPTPATAVPPVSPAATEASPPIVAPVETATTAPADPLPISADSSAATAAAIDAILAPAIESTLKAVEEQVASIAQIADAAQSKPPEPQLAEPQLAEPQLAEPPLPDAELAAPASLEVAPPAEVAVAPVAPEQASQPTTTNSQALEDAAAHVSAIMSPPVPAPAPAPTTTTGAAAERHALAEPLLSHATSAGGGRLSPLVRILQIVNYPMLLLPEEVRDALGKVAIVTTFNSIAVIIYVMKFRHPHH